MPTRLPSEVLSQRGGLYELAYGETLRFIAANVGGVPDYRAERRELIEKARTLRIEHATAHAASS